MNVDFYGYMGNYLKSRLYVIICADNMFSLGVFVHIKYYFYCVCSNIVLGNKMLIILYHDIYVNK